MKPQMSKFSNPIRAELPEALFEVLGAPSIPHPKDIQELESLHVACEDAYEAMQADARSAISPALPGPDLVSPAESGPTPNWREGMSEGELETYDEARNV